MAYTRNEPLGVVGQIIPCERLCKFMNSDPCLTPVARDPRSAGNFPILMFAWKVSCLSNLENFTDHQS